MLNCNCWESVSADAYSHIWAAVPKVSGGCTLDRAMLVSRVLTERLQAQRKAGVAPGNPDAAFEELWCCCLQELSFFNLAIALH